MNVTSVTNLKVQALQEQYAALKAGSTLLAGDLLDIPRRAIILLHIFQDSGENHVFPLLAAHGALWAYSYFEVGGAVGRFIAHRYFYNPAERSYRLGLLQEFASAFRRVNRQVCIDTYANYRFAQEYGSEPGADRILPASLLGTLNRVHAARRAGERLTAADRAEIFEQSFHCEQEVTVAPGVQAATAAFQCRILKFACLHPIVRFAYFPRFQSLFFRDFSHTTERVTKGLRAYEIAERAGLPHVVNSLKEYGLLPPSVLDETEAMFREIRAGARI